MHHECKMRLIIFLHIWSHFVRGERCSVMALESFGLITAKGTDILCVPLCWYRPCDRQLPLPSWWIEIPSELILNHSSLDKLIRDRCLFQRRSEAFLSHILPVRISKRISRVPKCTFIMVKYTRRIFQTLFLMKCQDIKLFYTQILGLLWS